MLVWNFFMSYIFSISFHKILYILSASLFEIYSRLLIFNSKHKQMLALQGPAPSTWCKILDLRIKTWLGRSDQKSRIYHAPRSALLLEIGTWKTKNSALFWILCLLCNQFLLDFSLAYFPASIYLCKWRELHGSVFMYPVSSPVLLFLSKVQEKAREIQLFLKKSPKPSESNVLNLVADGREWRTK